jgi:hypothetical protein
MGQLEFCSKGLSTAAIESGVLSGKVVGRLGSHAGRRMIAGMERAKGHHGVYALALDLIDADLELPGEALPRTLVDLAGQASALPVSIAVKGADAAMCRTLACQLSARGYVVGVFTDVGLAQAHARRQGLLAAAEGWGLAAALPPPSAKPGP